MKIHSQFLTLLLTLLAITISTIGFSQTRNLYVEGNGDQYAVIHALGDPSGGAGASGIELVRGDNNAAIDWRIVNVNGNLRFQSAIDNFSSSGDNKFSILENGYVGIGCTNPQAKLSICSGEIGFSNALSESQADKISLDGYRFEQPDMVGLGYEVSTVSSPGGTVELSHLYYKTEGQHRWYSNSNADGGSSAKMVLNDAGYLGVGITDPKENLHVKETIRIAGAVAHPSLEFFGTTSQSVESQITAYPALLNIEALGKDIRFLTAASANSAPTSRMVIEKATGRVGISTISPDVKLHVTNGSDAALNGGGYLQLGKTDQTNISIDNNEILARDNGAESPLYVQKDGGDLLLCSDELGQVGIGITSPATLPDASYLLAVDGKIIAEEVRVEMSGAWPDYVFQPDYDLMSIDKLKKSIQDHGHLPGIPSAQVVEDEGIALGDMQKRMMEKIEELSLYVIQLHDQNKQLSAELNELKIKLK